MALYLGSFASTELHNHMSQLCYYLDTVEEHQLYRHFEQCNCQ